MGVDVQVLSYPSSGVQAIPAAESVALAREVNDHLATAIKAHPDRFAGLAVLPTRDPKAAATELQRAVHMLGLKGALISGRTNDHFPWTIRSFTPSWKQRKPWMFPSISIRRCPSKTVQRAYYAGFDADVSASFATFGWGWHMETGVHALRMILGGVFDRYPRLQLILGHWGEMLIPPFWHAQLISVTPVSKTSATACLRLLHTAGLCDAQRHVYPTAISAHAADYGGRSHHVRR